MRTGNGTNINRNPCHKSESCGGWWCSPGHIRVTSFLFGIRFLFANVMGKFMLTYMKYRLKIVATNWFQSAYTTNKHSLDFINLVQNLRNDPKMEGNWQVPDQQTTSIEIKSWAGWQCTLYIVTRTPLKMRAAPCLAELLEARPLHT